MQSQTRMRPTCRAEVLEFILACGTRLEDPCIHILGVSTHGEDEVTDFDIRYSCSNQMKREHTYISYANNEFTDGTLDVPSLERYVQTEFKEPRLPDHLSFLQYWAKARVGEGPGSQAGIYFEHVVQDLPRTVDISNLAAYVAYGGKIRTRFYHSQAERRLVGFGDQWPPESQHCLHIRTVWRWTPDSSNTTPSGESETLQRWENTVRQAMIERHIGPLTDENVPSSSTSPRVLLRKESLQSDKSWFELTASTEIC